MARRLNIMKLLRTIFLVMVCVILGACESFELEPPSPTLIEAEASDVNGTAIVALVNSVDASLLLEERARRRGYQLVSKESLGGLDFVMLSFQPPRGVDGLSAIRELEKLEPHTTAGVNHRYTLEFAQSGIGLARDKHIGEKDRLSEAMITPIEYAHEMMGWPAHGCEANVAIGMIDGDVDLRAPALSSAHIETVDLTGGKGTLSTRAHGTAVAELLAGNGRLSGARIFSASVVSADIEGEASSVLPMVRAVDWMIQSGVRVVNISLAGPYNKILDRTIQRASDKGVVFVAAVGNAGANAKPRYPAAFRDVIAVTAIDQQKRIYRRAVNGSHVEYSAPGVDVYVIGSGSGRYVTGTSVAAPFVTSHIATHKGLRDRLRTGRISTKDIRDRLTSDAEDLGLAGADPVYGHGLVRVEQRCASD